MKYKLFKATLLECTEYIEEEIDTRRRRNPDDEFTAGYKIVRPITKTKEEDVLVIRLQNGKYIRYENVMGLSNILNYLRLSQSDGLKVLENQGYILKDKAHKKGDIFVDSTSLIPFYGDSKKAKQYVQKKKESKK